MDNLVQFLRDRLDEDEQAARAVLGVNVLSAMKRGKPVPRWVPSPEGDAGIWDTTGTARVKFVWARERDHIIRHDPARALAEVEAKRTLLRGATEWEGGTLLYYILTPLARIHRDHPDFDPAWLED